MRNIPPAYRASGCGDRLPFGALSVAILTLLASMANAQLCDGAPPPTRNEALARGAKRYVIRGLARRASLQGQERALEELCGIARTDQDAVGLLLPILRTSPERLTERIIERIGDLNESASSLADPLIAIADDPTDNRTAMAIWAVGAITSNTDKRVNDLLLRVRAESSQPIVRICANIAAQRRNVLAEDMANAQLQVDLAQLNGPSDRLKAALFLARSGVYPRAAVEWCMAAADGDILDESARWIGVFLEGANETAAARELFVNMASNGDVDVAVQGIEALAGLSELEKEEHSLLEAKIQSTHVRVRSAAAIALFRHGQESAALRQMRADSSSQTWIERDAGLLALGVVGQRDEAKESIRPILRTPHRDWPPSLMRAVGALREDGLEFIGQLERIWCIDRAAGEDALLAVYQISDAYLQTHRKPN